MKNKKQMVERKNKNRSLRTKVRAKKAATEKHLRTYKSGQKRLTMIEAFNKQMKEAHDKEVAENGKEVK